LGGNIRELSGKDGIWLNEKHTIFGVAAAVGISITFLVKKEGEVVEESKMFYIHPCDIRATRDEKIDFLQSNHFKEIKFEKIKPSDKHNWINISNNDFDSLLPLIDKKVKSGISDKAIFKLFSSGVKSQRDEWVYDFNNYDLQKKVKFMIGVYQKTLADKKNPDKMKIKWDRELNKYLDRKIEKKFEKESVINAVYRPFTKMWFYFDRHFNGMTYQWPEIQTDDKQKIICIPGVASPKNFHTLSVNTIIDLNSLPAGVQCLPLNLKENKSNITDWGLEQFVMHYKDKKIKKEDIFHYVYGVLHNPAYRKKYELNLKREFPRIPFYKDFWQWAKLGKQLMDLHINYEEAKPFSLKRIDEKPNEKKEKQKEFFPKVKEPEAMFGIKPKVKIKLKADKQAGEIEIDEITKLKGIPKEAWEYKLGNRSALEWILDQYKEKKPKDKTIAEKFNTYRFADYKEYVIELLKKVTTVSVETMKIIREMEKIK
jgi:predicted helicase